MPSTALELLTTPEAAELFRVSESTIRLWRRTGILPTVKIGGVYRFRRSDIERIILNPEGVAAS